VENNFNLKKFLVENKLTTNSRLIKEGIGHMVAFNATPEEVDKNIDIFTKAAEKLGFDWKVKKHEDGEGADVFISQKKDGPDELYSPEATALRKLLNKILVPFQERQRIKNKKSKSPKGGKKVNIGDQVEYDGDQWVVVGMNGSEIDIMEIGNDGYTVQPEDISQKNPKEGDIVDGPGIDSYQALVVGIDEDGIAVMELTDNGITIDKSEL
jgi:hypothetical protein